MAGSKLCAWAHTASLPANSIPRRPSAHGPTAPRHRPSSHPRTAGHPDQPAPAAPVQRALRARAPAAGRVHCAQRGRLPRRLQPGVQLRGCGAGPGTGVGGGMGWVGLEWDRIGGAPCVRQLVTTPLHCPCARTHCCTQPRLSHHALTPRSHHALPWQRPSTLRCPSGSRRARRRCPAPAPACPTASRSTWASSARSCGRSRARVSPLPALPVFVWLCVWGREE